MQNTDAIIDLIIERPRRLEFGGRSFIIRPLTLGKVLFISKFNSMLSPYLRRKAKNPQETLLRMCREKPEVVTEVVAIYITGDAKKVIDDDYMNELTTFLSKEMTDVQKATLLQMYYEEKTAAYYMDELHITEEKEKQRKAIRAKDKGSSLNVGGVSIFGNLIDVACERYGWTYQYVLWGISYNVLQVMLADVVQNIYLTAKERARTHINEDGRILRGESQADIDYFKSLCDG